jgi:(1->4)-alpha-D-glucan 1-alpha-D-glucosylmutase
MLNSLSQTLLKIASPGVPDFYQGTELWDLSLVDPDNRRPVDYTLRAAMLREIKRAAAIDRLALARKLFANPADGAIKMYITSEALGLRRRNEMLFGQGPYRALETSGTRLRKVIAFARGGPDYHVIVVAGRFFTDLLYPPSDQAQSRSMAVGGAPSLAVGDDAWQDTFLSIPAAMLRERYVEVFTGQEVRAQRDRDRRQLSMADIFRHMTVALLVPVAEP